jgi:hypothetical protein
VGHWAGLREGSGNTNDGKKNVISTFICFTRPSVLQLRGGWAGPVRSSRRGGAGGGADRGRAEEGEEQALEAEEGAAGGGGGGGGGQHPHPLHSHVLLQSKWLSQAFSTVRALICRCSE